ncbi:hypothetical protein VB735_31945 [Halotia wernerae UHCC 0503]|nr:hypothetical protein [Halotia wernerae UHCC 0503]
MDVDVATGDRFGDVSVGSSPLNTLEIHEAPLNRHIAILSRQIELPHQDPGDRCLQVFI